MKIIVCIKQVPDTTEIKIDPIKGTLMRDGVPSILNPDDANALEAALAIKDEYPDTEVDVLSMGPEQASYALRECLAMGADNAYLLSSRAFGGADTCSTSTTLAYGVKKIGDYDFIFAGRQAIDGDTAQVGPQVAEKLALPQVTYAEEIQGCDGKIVTIKRRLERGIEVVTCPVPCVVTVNGSAAPCRPRNARFVMKYKNAKGTQEAQDANEDYFALVNERPYLKLTEWSVNDVQSNPEDLGLSGSPTKVKNIESVVFQAKEAKVLSGTDAELDAMMKELITNHTIG